MLALGRAVGLAEAVEDVRQKFGFDALPRVADDQQRLAFHLFQADFDQPARRGEFDRVDGRGSDGFMVLCTLQCVRVLFIPRARSYIRGCAGE